jgi:superfamily II DNA helicase RecQ
MNEDHKQLPEEEIRAILRAADELIMQGGRTLLAKILKGSREKKVLALELDKCPVYGFFHAEKLEEVTGKIDWMIDHGFLDIEYSGKLPMIVFTDRGWYIERDQRANEFLLEWDEWISQNEPVPDMEYLKDRNRGMIFLLLDKVAETGDEKYIPYLKGWQEIDYKKVKARIHSVIKALEDEKSMDERAIIQDREDDIKEALKGEIPQDILLKCWECGERFTFTMGEQQFYKQMGFLLPKRCQDCRFKRKYGLEDLLEEDEFL